MNRTLVCMLFLFSFLNLKAGIIPLNRDVKPRLTSAFFGYLPYWEYQKGKNYLRYDLLTHIAAFDFEADSTGGMTEPYFWPWTDLIDSAHSKGVRVIMTVTCFDQKIMHKILNDPGSRNNFFQNIRTKLSLYSLDGVNIDFENPSITDRKTISISFMKDLSDFVHNNFPDSETSFAGPAVNWGGWDLVSLAKSCDYIFIMGYDYYGKSSQTCGPSSPVSGMKYCLQSTITAIGNGYGAVTSSMPEKLILGVPYYGNHWTTETSTALSAKIKFIHSTRFDDNCAEAQKYGRIWEETYGVPRYCYQSEGIWHQVWYDDAQSIGLKYDLAKSKKLKGAGTWSLGNDGSRPELWNMIEDKFIQGSSAVGQKDKNAVRENFILRQNYPNPFNPSTKISFSLPGQAMQGNKPIRMSLKVYDTLGREIACLMDQDARPGNFEVPFSADAFNLPAGVYLYRLQAGKFTQTRKLIFLK